MNASSLITQIQERIQSYRSLIVSQSVSHKAHIVEVGSSTVSTDEKGKFYLQSVPYPAIFSEQEIKVILSMNWLSENGDIVEPIAYSRDDWYKHRITILEDGLELLRRHSDSIHEI